MIFFIKIFLRVKHTLLRVLDKLNLIYLKDYRNLLFDELKEFKIKSNLEILEIGPKDGVDTKRLLSLKPKRLTLIELPDKKKIVNKWLNKLDLSLIDIFYENIMYQDSIFKNSPFDIVWCTGVL